MSEDTHSSLPTSGIKDYPLDPRRREQVRRRIEDVSRAQCAEARALNHQCATCGFYTPSACVCRELKPLPCKHKVTVMLHPSELGRSTSTHQIMALTLQHSEVCVWNSDAYPTGEAIWDHVLADCKHTNRCPVVLFPAPDALTVPELFAGMTEEQRKAGLHVVVLEGTWPNAKSMISDVPSSAQKIVIQPVRVDTLFSTLRTQPAPGKVSTLEAVAALFDEMRTISRTPTAVADALTPRVAPVSEVLVSSAAKAVAGSRVAADFEGKDFWGTRLRYYLMVWVDAVSCVSNRLTATGHMVGYRTWYVARSGQLSSIPARCLAEIYTYAYGTDALPAAGYRAKRAVGNQHWQAVFSGSDCPGGAGESDDGSVHSPIYKRKWHHSPVAVEKEKLPKVSRRGLPVLPGGLTPLALASNGLYLFAAGKFRGSWIPSNG